MKSVLKYLFLVIIAISMIYPFIAMLNLSFVPNGEILNQGDRLFYSPLTLENYSNVFHKIPMFKYFINSLFVSICTTLGQVFISAIAGYAFACFKFRGRDVLFFIFLVTMLVPPQVNIVPLFFIMRQLHWINTYQAMILPGIFGGLGVFYMRQYFLGFPKDLIESAKIDGCNSIKAVLKIALPLSIPALATLGIFTFVSSWNSFMWPLIVTNSESMRTLPVGLAIFKGSFREITLWGDLLACSVICTIPIILVFLFGKKYLINDIMSGGVKE